MVYSVILNYVILLCIMLFNVIIIYNRRKFRSLTSTIRTDEQQSREVMSEESRARRKKIQSREMLGKSRIAVFFQ